MAESCPRLVSYSIGELAARAGVSVRTLRHYEAVGLLGSTARTAAGHRRYGPADAERLLPIASLRALGLPLGQIRDALDGTPLPDLLGRHLAAVRARIADATRLAEQLAALLDRLGRSGSPEPDALFSILRLTAMIDTHYTPEQLEQLRRRAEILGQERIDAVQTAWPDLFAEFDALREAGVPPEAPETAPLVARAQGFIAEFTGGDAGLERSLNAYVQSDKAAMYAPWGITPESGAYYDAAMAAHGTP